MCKSKWFEHENRMVYACKIYTCASARRWNNRTIIYVSLCGVEGIDLAANEIQNRRCALYILYRLSVCWKLVISFYCVFAPLDFLFFCFFLLFYLNCSVVPISFGFRFRKKAVLKEKIRTTRYTQFTYGFDFFLISILPFVSHRGVCLCTTFGVLKSLVRMSDGFIECKDIHRESVSAKHTPNWYSTYL